MTVAVFAHGTIGGRAVRGFRLCGPELVLTLSEYGARILSLEAPDRDGVMGDVVVGPASLAALVESQAYFGATCGRFANRIAGAEFPLDGRIVELTANEGPNQLHGGRAGFDRKIWQGEPDADGRGVMFTRVSPAGEEGYPGTLHARVAYRLAEAGFAIEIAAETDAPTMVNLVNHTYWNLSAGRKPVIADHGLMVDAGAYLPVGDGAIPTGEVRPVDGTAFDLRQPGRIGDGLSRLAALGDRIGYDHAFCLAGAGGDLAFAARLVDPESGRGFDLATDQPSVQVYAGGKLGASEKGKDGAPLAPFGGLCLETQRYPNAPNVAHFPSARLDPGERYRHRMAFRFFTA